MTLLPERPEFVRRNLLSTFGSYTSKSSGNLTSGLESNFRLPVPEMTSLTVTASLVLTFVLLIEEVILNSPTPPEKSAGLPCWQGFYVNRQLRSQNCLLNFYVIASSIEKCLERISNLCSLCNGSVKACSINRQLTGLLWEQHKLTIDCRLIISTFIMLQSPSSVIRKFHFLRMESFEVGQTSHCQTYASPPRYISCMSIGMLLVHTPSSYWQ